MALRVATIANQTEFGEPINGGVQAVTSYLVRALLESLLVELHVKGCALEGSTIVPSIRNGTCCMYLRWGASER